MEQRPGTARQSVLSSRRDSVSRNSAAAFAALAATARGDSPGDRPGTGRSSIMRQSGRYGPPSPLHRGSRAGSVARGSIRYGRGGTGVDSSGLPFERIVCIDEDGRDRTPKPLIAARPHGTGDALPGTGSTGAGGGGWPGEAPGLVGSGGDVASGRDSILSFAPLLGSASLPTARSFMTSESSEASREASFDGGALPAGRAAHRPSTVAAPSGGGAAAAALTELAAAAAAAAGERQAGGGDSALTAGMLEVGRLDHAPLPPQQQQQQQHSPGNGNGNGNAQPQQSRQQEQERQRHKLRSKATQCRSAARASRGIQVLSWELQSTGVDADAEDAADGPLLPGASAGDPDAEAEKSEDAEDEEALLAMSHPGGAGFAGSEESHRSSPTPSNHGHSQSASRRGSMAGSGRLSILHSGGSEHTSRPGTSAGSRRTSFQVGADWSARESFSSRTSFSTAFSRADGRASVAGLFNTPGSGGRASIMAHKGGGMRDSSALATPHHQPTAEELAAAAARRQKAELERALARLPGLLQKLESAEKAVLINQHHAKLAQYHSVLYCSGAQLEPAPAPQEPAAAAPVGHVQRRSRPAHLPAPASEATGSEPQPHSGSARDSMAAMAQAAAAAATAAEPAGGNAPFFDGPSPLVSSRQPNSELQLLWTWQSELTDELPVSCVAFNRAAPGLLAVGYGRLEYAVSGTGMVAVWSLANPTHPLWHAATPCGVSALDWSSKSAGCLAAGFFNGGIALYDVRSSSGRSRGAGSSSSAGAGPKPFVQAPPAGAAGSSTGGHAEPVWRLRYVPKASDPGEEMLVSVSSDGRMLEWKHPQGLERSELLRLKRQQSTAARRLHNANKEAQAGAEGYLGRAAGGTCFDFCPSDPRTYLVGTEDGGVHKCSTAFSEQYIQSYYGHLAPVYQVCWSPFSPSLFLTASADWSVRLWSEGQGCSLWAFQLPSSKAEVADVAFCPAAATLFAAAVGNTLQLWDVERSVLAPAATATRFGTRLTALAFSQEAPVVVVGADDGAVAVYSLAGLYDSMNSGPAHEEGQRQRLEAALRHHTAQATSD